MIAASEGCFGGLGTRGGVSQGPRGESGDPRAHCLARLRATATVQVGPAGAPLAILERS